MIALTATASFETMEIIKEDLCFSDCLEIIVSPNKLNIKYDKIDIKNDDVRENFKWLIQLLEKHGISTPRMIIFFRKVDHMSIVYKHVINCLGKMAYHNYQENGRNDDRNRLIDMFHMKTSDVVKSSICKSYDDPAGHIRVVLCSTSFSMGLDVKGVFNPYCTMDLLTALKITFKKLVELVEVKMKTVLPFYLSINDHLVVGIYSQK